MLDEHRNILFREWNSLCGGINHEALRNKLHQKRFISEAHIQDIKTHDNNTLRNERLLSILQTCGRDAFVGLYESLIDIGQTDIARLICDGLPSTYTYDQSRPVQMSPSPARHKELKDGVFDSCFGHSRKMVTRKESKIAAEPVLPLQLNSSIDFNRKTMYSHFSQPRGPCLIINNKNFEHESMKTRDYTELDRQLAIDTFSWLGYKVYTIDDCTAAQMLDAVGQLASIATEMATHKQCDSIVLIVLTHGANGYLYGVDGHEQLPHTKVDVAEITQLLGCNNAPKTALVPKLLFLQACRSGCKTPQICQERRRCDCSSTDAGFVHIDQGDGNVGDASELMSNDSIKSTSSEKYYDAISSYNDVIARMHSDENVTEDDMRRALISRDIADSCSIRQHMPSDANFLIGYPSSVGLESFRRSDMGSWYISTLCNVLREEAHRSHLLEILTVVANRVAGMSTASGSKQMPQIQSTLLYKFYFMFKN